MAIQKSKCLPCGNSGNYWKIIAEQYDRLTGHISWTIALFKDQAASNAGRKYMGVLNVYRTSISREDAAGNRTLFGYNFIRTKSAQIETPIFGGNPIQYDPDLANGENV